MDSKIDKRIADMDESIAIPRKNGELVFEAPWEARAFGLAVALSDEGLYPWKDFSEGLATEIATAEREGREATYYELWLATLEKLLIANGLTTLDELDARTEQQAWYDLHDHDHPHPHPIPMNLPSLPVKRVDGRMMRVVQHRGHLMVCSKGCCCGITERSYAYIPEELYHNEWENRKLRNRVHLTQSGCLGPCVLANVVLLFFDGRPIWFQAVDTEELILAIYDYIESMLEADGYLPPPPPLADLVFDFYTWSSTQNTP